MFEDVADGLAVGLSRAGEFGRRHDQGAFGRPPALRDHRHPAVADDDPGNARNALCAGAREAGQAATPWGNADRRVKQAGQAHVAGEAHTAVALGGKVDARQRLTQQLAAADRAESELGRRSQLRCLDRQLAKAKTFAFVNDESAFAIAFGGRDIPALGRGLGQQGACRGARLAQGQFEGANRGRSRSDTQGAVGSQFMLAPSSDATVPALFVGQPVGIYRRGRRRLDRDILPRRAKLVGEDLRKRGPYSLPGFDLRDDNRDAAVGAHLEEMAEHAFAGPGTQAAANVASATRRRPRPARRRHRRQSAARGDRPSGAPASMRVLRFQRDAVDLAGAEARQWVRAEDHPLRDLERGKAGFEESLQAGAIERAAIA